MSDIKDLLGTFLQGRRFSAAGVGEARAQAPGISGANEPFLPPGYVVIENYTIQRCIGRGGMSEVYHAKNYLGADVALKILRPEYIDESDYILLLEKEADLRRVNHKAIVEYYVVQHANFHGRDFIFLTMEFVDGPTLSQAMREHGQLPGDVVLRILKRIASGLEAAHERRIFHRDISPDNIVLRNSDPDEAVLIDFGIARSETSETTVLGERYAGKLRYSAPEQFRGIVNGQTDLYALGMTMLAAARGAAKALDDRAPDGAPLVEGLDPRVAYVIGRMTKQDPTKRLRSACALDHLFNQETYLRLPKPPPAALTKPIAGADGKTDDADATILVAQ